MTYQDHMSWCIGKHREWDCIFRQVVPFRDGFNSTVEMTGARGEYVSIQVVAGATLVDVDAVDAYVHHLADLIDCLDAFRGTFAASQSEATPDHEGG